MKFESLLGLINPIAVTPEPANARFQSRQAGSLRSSARRRHHEDLPTKVKFIDEPMAFVLWNVHCSCETSTLHPDEYVAFAFTLLMGSHSWIEHTAMEPSSQLASVLLAPVPLELAAVFVLDGFEPLPELDPPEPRPDESELSEPDFEPPPLESASVELVGLFVLLILLSLSPLRSDDDLRPKIGLS